LKLETFAERGTIYNSDHEQTRTLG